MSEFDTIADLFPEDRHPTRPLEPIQKVDQVDQIERDIEEFYETPSAKNVLEETTEIVTDRGGQKRFRYVHATFGSGKSHLLKLIGVATGEIEGLEDAAHKLANETTGFRAFREALDESYIDHLQPLLMNLLDRDRQGANLPLLLYEELGRRRNYPTDRPWLLEFSWRLDIVHDLWDQAQQTDYEGLTFDEAVDRPASLRAWLKEVIPGLDGAAAAGFESPSDVAEEIEQAKAAVETETFSPDELVDRLSRTRDHLNSGGEVYEFLIGLDEIAIYVGDQPRRYDEVVDTIEALFEGLGSPILGTGQWPMRDMQQDFVGDVDEDEWYANEVELEGADTETIVRNRWLQKSTAGSDYIESTLLEEAPSLEPPLKDDADITDHDNPVEAYPFRDRDLWLLRAAMQGLIEGDRESEREYIQGRALLVRVRSLFDTHGWANRQPGEIVSWDVLYDVLQADTALIPEWAHDLVQRVADTAESVETLDDELAARTTKALFLLSQVDEVPRTAATLARLLADEVDVELESLTTTVESQLETLAKRNLIREDVETSPTEYTILSEEDIHFWQQVQEAAAEVPHPQFRTNVRQYIQEAGSDRLTNDDITAIRDFKEYSDVPYTVRYTIDTSPSSSPTERYDAIVVRLLAGGGDAIASDREEWQEIHGGPQGVEEVLVVVDLPEGIRRQIRQLIGMKQVMDSMADPRPELRLERQTEDEAIQDEIADRLENAHVYLPSRAESYGIYLESFDGAVAGQVDDKFPNRKSIETQIQQGDLGDLVEFFEGDGPWPLTDADAEELGVNTVPRTIDNGWVTEFLQIFEDEDRVSGERILETIGGRRGEFLGTPENALHALLFVLVADGRVEIRSDGERLSDESTIASHITRRGYLADSVIGFDPQPPAEGLEDVYAELLGEEPETDDAAVLCPEIASWASENGSKLRKVVTRTNMVFGTGVTLESLETALEPALAGEELDANLLSNPTIVDQAELYAKVEPLFTGEDGDAFWDQYKETFDTVNELYPNATEVKQMRPYATGNKVPDADLIESQMEAAANLRVNRLQRLYRLLDGAETTANDLDSLRSEITEVLANPDTEAAIDNVANQFEKVTFDALRTLVEKAEEHEDPLPEAELADADVHHEAETLADAQILLETEVEGESLYKLIRTVHSELEDSHPDSFATQQLGRALEGTAIPDRDRAERLLTQGRSLLDSDDSDEIDSEDQLDQLWQSVTSHEEGTIVVIDTEDDR